MEQTTRVKTRVQDKIGIMDISGEVTSVSEKVIQDAYEKFTTDGLKRIGLNLDQVSYINSAGMAIIIGILTQSRKRGQTLRAWGLSEHFQKIFSMIGITKYMDHFGSEAEALKGF
ncbi:MAG: STAS domain-containing protein [bacterium]